MEILNMEEANAVLNWLNMLAGREEVGHYEHNSDTDTIVFVSHDDE